MNYDPRDDLARLRRILDQYENDLESETTRRIHYRTRGDFVRSIARNIFADVPTLEQWHWANEYAEHLVGDDDAGPGLRLESRQIIDVDVHHGRQQIHISHHWQEQKKNEWIGNRRTVELSGYRNTVELSAAAAVKWAWDCLAAFYDSIPARDGLAAPVTHEAIQLDDAARLRVTIDPAPAFRVSLFSEQTLDDETHEGTTPMAEHELRRLCSAIFWAEKELEVRKERRELMGDRDTETQKTRARAAAVVRRKTNQKLN